MTEHDKWHRKMDDIAQRKERIKRRIVQEKLRKEAQAEHKRINGTLTHRLQQQDEQHKKEAIIDEKNIQEIQQYIERCPERLVFGGEIDKEYIQGKLQIIWTRNRLRGYENRKTKVILIRNKYLCDYGGRIGLLWFNNDNEQELM